MAASPVDLESQLVDELGAYTHDPLGFSEYAFDWQDGELLQSVGPRTWQAEILKYIGDWLGNPETRYQPCQIAVASGHGIGKTALISMLLSWGLTTCEDARATITANTKAQLDTKTVPEVTKWFRRAINSHWFDVAATSIRIKDAKSAKTWRADFTPWSEQNPDAFAGLHNNGKRILLVFDEASGIPPVIWETAEGAMTDEDCEIIWVAFGNPLRKEGRFYDCFGKHKHRWKTFQIDARNVEGTNKAQIAKWREDWGEDSDFFKVRVRGEFPSSSSSQFIDSDMVAAARKYKAQGFEQLPKVLSVDVARFGDDQTVMGWRQGRKFAILKKFRGLDTVQVAERVIQFYREAQYSAIVVDGDGLGAGVVDQIKHRGFGKNLFEFHGAEKANDFSKYSNRRTEIWGEMRDWLKHGAEIPDEAEIETDLCGPDYYFNKANQIQLESKDDMKARGLASPDVGDCLAMTFAVTLKKQDKPRDYGYAFSGSGTSWMG